MAIYKGFSTVNRYRGFRLTDTDLIKQDLLNHFNIRKGEKLSDPNFGSIIWSVLFDNLTDELRNLIIEDVKAVIKYDPRVRVNQVLVSEYEHGIQIECELITVNTNQLVQMNVQFDNSRTAATIY